MSALNNDLVELKLDSTSHASNDQAANGAPSGEPESWNPNIALHNPHLGQTPEPEPIHVSAEFAANFNISDYLAEERGKDLLRFSTAGSVDDGKSTLIGRLLYDTQSVYDDQIQSIEGKGTTAPGVLDLALLTDGLRAEREQGITIDVAYRYFSTARRKFIIADTPGHEQYTRNMATGASTADVAVVLVDARKGVLIQSRRHAYITALLGVRNVIVAVNKMDLVDYSEEVFGKIQQDFTRFFHDLDVDGNDQTTLHFVPVSALAGDNVVHSSSNTPWYRGQTLLGLLESIPSSQVNVDAPFRMAVQRVIRPNLDFRGFAGQISAGIIRVGDTITALPSGKHSKVQRIVTFDGDLPEAFAPLSVTLTLEDEIDISRGDLLVNTAEQPVIAKGFTASLVWMDETPLELGKRYLLKQGSRSVPAQVSTLVRTVDLSEVPGQLSHHKAASTLSMNGIGNVTVEALQPLAFDTYAANRHTGSFVLIDLQTNATVAAGMIRKAELTGTQAAAQITRDIILHPTHALRLQGSEDAIAAAIEALRSAGALREND
ncbi:sulfate adenylyltransferase subunit CysN [Terriglobus roseus]|uniref:Sulfate adenylyltransferase subunit 1 n=1 Tax=Terriglobus roseus TaxID=392734 RepID=A0A1H4SVV8_9BACT|nr:sulfate adenylyltransferase subunit CysN [Terriglobus roseus]SEC48011.1 sulfate adenylyltransferase subunit 1 [Terriglobus roseus]